MVEDYIHASTQEGVADPVKVVSTSTKEVDSLIHDKHVTANADKLKMSKPKPIMVRDMEEITCNYFRKSLQLKI